MRHRQIELAAAARFERVITLNLAPFFAEPNLFLLLRKAKSLSII